MNYKIKKISLYGPSGAGKGTFANLFMEKCKISNVPCQLLKIAEPLYELQSKIYGMAGCSLENRYNQDGLLLQYLGNKFREINPRSLIDIFENELDRIYSEMSKNFGCGFILCDDMRYPDFQFLKDMGFVFVKLKCSRENIFERKVARGDISNSDDYDILEMNFDSIQHGYLIDNSGSIEDLKIKVSLVIDKLL